MSEKKRKLFEDENVFSVVLKLAIPTMISQIILVIYNMADTFFIGLTESDVKLSAVTVCLPAFMFLSAIANLFGIGASATISRAIGNGKKERAAAAAGFAFWACLFVTAFYSLLAFLLRDVFVYLLGGIHENVHTEAVRYLMITVVIGGVFTSLNSMLSHLVRSEGRALRSGIGIALGGILNIVLDPLFMFVLLPPGLEVIGAAIATALSNFIACAYFLWLIPRLSKKGSVLTIRFAPKLWEKNMLIEVLRTGAPASLMTLFENISYAVLDHLMAYGGIAMQAGIGVAKKVNMLAHSIVRGMAQGVLPLIAYNFGCGNLKRMKQSILISSLISVSLAAVCMTINLVFAQPLVDIFTADGPSQLMGARFLRILTLGCPFSAFGYAIISYMQAVKETRKSFLLSILRKGVLDIPMMLLLFFRSGPAATVWATPAADFICCAAAVAFFIISLRHLASPLSPSQRLL